MVAASPDGPYQRQVEQLEHLIFDHKKIALVLFSVFTLVMAFFAVQVKIDAGFAKSLPLDHPYIADTYLKPEFESFRGADRVIVALEQAKADSDIFEKDFLLTLRDVTDKVSTMAGVDSSRVFSIFTPNVRFTEVVEEGFAGGDVVPAETRAQLATAEGEQAASFLVQIRENTLKSGQVGRLVANNFKAAIVSAELVETDAAGNRLNYLDFAHKLESEIRAKYESAGVKVRIIGFAKAIGDTAEGAASVIAFFGVAVLLTAALIYIYGRSISLTLIQIIIACVAVIWQLGILVLIGFGIDPLSILVPFLVFAIAISHGVQNVGTITLEMGRGNSIANAARLSFNRLFVPGVSALLTDAVSFLTIMIIDIPMIRELAISCSIGMVVVVFSHMILLPIVLGYLPLGDVYAQRMRRQLGKFDGVWRAVSVVARPRAAAITLLAGLAVFGWSVYAQQNMIIGDLDEGVPELWPDSRYNQDAKFVVSNFAIGVDLIQVMATAPADQCNQYAVIRQIDELEYAMRNVPGVQSTLSLAAAMKLTNAGWNEGNPAWRTLSRNSQVLARSQTNIETSTGLLNSNCSVMPIQIFTVDHKATTIDRVVHAFETYVAENPSTDGVKFQLATGNVGVMAATNQTVEAAEVPMLLWVYAVIVFFCMLTFRSLAASLCVVIPLIVVSILANALMAELSIGLKIATLPVAALGVGIGVDYGLYIFSRLKVYLDQGLVFADAYFQTLREVGSAVFFTGLTLAIGVSTWMFSALKFQADMGVLLTFLFLMNMLGAVLLLPAMAALVDRVVPFPRKMAAGTGTLPAG